MVTMVPNARSFLMTSMGFTASFSDKSFTVTISGIRTFCRTTAGALATGSATDLEGSPFGGSDFRIVAGFGAGRGAGALKVGGGGILYVAVGSLLGASFLTSGFFTSFGGR